MKRILLFTFFSFWTSAAYSQAPGSGLDFIDWGNSPKEIEAQLMESGIPFTPYDKDHQDPSTTFRHQELRSRLLYKADALQSFKLTRAFGLSEMEEAKAALDTWEARIQKELPNIPVKASRSEQQTVLLWTTEEVEIKLSLLLGMNLELTYTRKDASLESTARN